LFVNLRVFLGITFITHGALKFMAMAGTVQFFTHIGIPLPGVAAPVIALLEVAGGLALILGIGTQIVSILLAIDMLMAAVLVKGSAGFVGGYEFELSLLVALVALVLSGPGAWALTGRKVLKGAGA
jgi:putative oxidoreductase